MWKTEHELPSMVCEQKTNIIIDFMFCLIRPFNSNQNIRVSTSDHSANAPLNGSFLFSLMPMEYGVVFGAVCVYMIVYKFEKVMI